MEKRFIGTKEDLENAKSKPMSSKLKKFISAALIGANLLAVGAPTHSYAYTTDQLSMHEQHVEEYRGHYNSIMQNTASVLDKSVKDGTISKEQYKEGMDSIIIFNKKAEKNVKQLQNKQSNILDKNLVFIKTLPSQKGDTKPRVQLVLNDISSMSKAQIENLEKNYHIDMVTMNRFYDSENHNLSSYSPEKYKELLTKINTDFGDLKSNKQLSDLEKATIVLKRMSTISYDYNALQTYVGETPENPIDNVHNNSKEKIWTSRTMEDPLMNNTGICGGYSDMFKNVMSYLDIESKEIRGYVESMSNPNTIPGEVNHAWNQIKLNNKWYNVDITMLNTTQINSLQPNMPHPYLFVGDADMNDQRSALEESDYQPILGLHQNATDSISNEDIDNALQVAINYEKNISKNNKSLFSKIADKFTASKDKKVNENIDKSEHTSNNTTSTYSEKREEFMSYLKDSAAGQKNVDTPIKANALEKQNKLSEKNDFERG